MHWVRDALGSKLTSSGHSFPDCQAVEPVFASIKINQTAAEMDLKIVLTEKATEVAFLHTNFFQVLSLVLCGIQLRTQFNPRGHPLTLPSA